MRTIAPDDRWIGLVGMYGGYVAALFADEAADPEYWLASLTIRFRAGVEHDKLELDSTQIHRGRRAAGARMTLVQGGRVRAEAEAVSVRRAPTPARVERVAQPRHEPPTEYAVRPHIQGELPYASNLEVRTPPDGGTRAWMRLTASPAEAGLRTPQAVLCVLADALLPVVFTGDDPPAFVPTLEFGYTFTPAVDDLSGQWVIGENRLDWQDAGMCAEDATLTEATTGRLMARQRQLRSIRRGGFA